MVIRAGGIFLTFVLAVGFIVLPLYVYFYDVPPGPSLILEVNS